MGPAEPATPVFLLPSSVPSCSSVVHCLTPSGKTAVSTLDYSSGIRTKYSHMLKAHSIVAGTEQAFDI